MEKLLCGAAKADITPDESMLPMPLLGPLKFTHINDHVFVRALAFACGKERCLLLSFDLTVVPYPDILLSALSEELSLGKANIFVCVTHTHETTPLGLSNLFPSEKEEAEKRQRWFEQIQAAALSVAKASFSSLRPCRVGYGTGKSYVNCNRDEIKSGDKAELGFNFERPSDKTVKLVRIEDEAGGLIAVLINYACHAVVMNGCIERGGMGISGDLPGRTSSAIEEAFGGVCLWTSGAAGDQNPRMMTNFGVKLVDGKPVYQNLGETGHLVLELLSEEHVRDVKRALEKISCSSAEGPIFCRQARCFCPRTDGKETQYLCSLMKIGPVTFEGVDGEVPTSTGAAIVSVSPEERTVFISHANGYQGYIPDDWQLEHRSFEAEGAPLQPGYAEKRLTEAFRTLFAELA